MRLVTATDAVLNKNMIGGKKVQTIEEIQHTNMSINSFIWFNNLCHTIFLREY